MMRSSASVHRSHNPLRLVRVREGLSECSPPKRTKTREALTERLSGQARKCSRPAKPRPRALIAALATLSWLVAIPAAQAQSARSLVQQGNESYQKEEYGSALDSYEKAAEQAPGSPHIWFNRGSALYKEGQYDKAIDAFEQAALSSDDAAIEALSKFSQGNTSFRKGVAQQETNPQQALASVERGVQLYQDALKVDPGLNDARHNIEVARRTMQRLMELLENQPTSPSQGQGKNQDQDQQDQDQQQDASERLKDLIEKQEDAAEQSESAAQQQKSGPDSQQMERKAEDLAKQQQQLKDETEELAEKMKSQQQQQGQSSPAEKAQENLEQAAQKQSQAQQQLKDQKFDQAQASQKEAQKDLEKALQAMNGEAAGQQQDQSQQTARNQPPSGEQQRQMQQAAEDILDKEKADRQSRQTGIAIRIIPVDRDW